VKILITCLIVLSMILVYIPAYAETITLPNGQELNIDDLSDYEITQAINTAKKSIKASESALGIIKGANPQELEAWAKLITETIKTICQDLSITVNDFVKTPVGFGVAALITYKVMGKDILENALDLIIMIPLWFFMTGIILFVGWYFYSTKTYYNKIYFDDKGKQVKEGLVRETRFPWVKEEWKRGEISGQTMLAIVLITSQVGGTILTLLIVLG
jgi:translation elongation factor EF-1beta